MGKVKEVDGDVGLMRVCEDPLTRSHGLMFPSDSRFVCLLPSHRHDQLYKIYVSLAAIQYGSYFGHMP